MQIIADNKLDFHKKIAGYLDKIANKPKDMLDKIFLKCIKDEFKKYKNIKA
jgi:hypothetical protein